MDIEELPGLDRNMKLLKALKMSFSAIKSIRSTVWKLERLEDAELSGNLLIEISMISGDIPLVGS